MPYKSQAQRGKFHAMEERGEISPKVVKEFDQASKGMKLPQKVGKGADVPRMHESSVNRTTPRKTKVGAGKDVPRTGESSVRRASPQKVGVGENWIAGAIKHPGAFSAKAKKAGKSTSEYAEEKKNAPGATGKQARLAQTLGKLRK